MLSHNEDFFVTLNRPVKAGQAEITGPPWLWHERLPVLEGITEVPEEASLNPTRLSCFLTTAAPWSDAEGFRVLGFYQAVSRASSIGGPGGCGGDGGERGGAQGPRVPTPQQQAAMEAHIAQGRALAAELGLSGSDGLTFLRLTPAAQQRVPSPPPSTPPLPSPPPLPPQRERICLLLRPHLLKIPTRTDVEVNVKSF